MNQAIANMEQLVSHWKTLQPTTVSKKRRREPDEQPARTKSKTQDHIHSNTTYQNHQHGTQSTPEQNSFS
jgi:hypothetical protein